MKKLLLLTNFVCAFFLFASCQNQQKSTQDGTIEAKPTADTNDIVVAKPVIKDSSTISKSSDKSEIKKTTVSGTAGNEKTTKTDVIKNNTENPKAIIHKAPEQDKLDSIKNAKTKNKK